ncbi:MAG: cupin domain-containing protein [Acidimicrobiia bacterium]
MTWQHGRLGSPADAPAQGETTRFVARLTGATVEEIHSGALEEATEYESGVDEWVVVLAGAATLVVEGERLALTAGSWVLLPAGTPHTLVETEPGTHWLTVTGT